VGVVCMGRAAHCDIVTWHILSRAARRGTYGSKTTTAFRMSFMDMSGLFADKQNNTHSKNERQVIRLKNRELNKHD